MKERHDRLVLRFANNLRRLYWAAHAYIKSELVPSYSKTSWCTTSYGIRYAKTLSGKTLVGVCPALKRPTRVSKERSHLPALDRRLEVYENFLGLRVDGRFRQRYGCYCLLYLY